MNVDSCSVGQRVCEKSDVLRWPGKVLYLHFVMDEDDGLVPSADVHWDDMPEGRRHSVTTVAVEILEQIDDGGIA